MCGPKEYAGLLPGGIGCRAARTLPVIPSGSYRDHVFVFIRVPVAEASRADETTPNAKHNERDVWDFDRLAAAVQTDEGKDVLLEDGEDGGEASGAWQPEQGCRRALEALTRRRHDDWPEALHEGAPAGVGRGEHWREHRLELLARCGGSA